MTAEALTTTNTNVMGPAKKHSNTNIYQNLFFQINLNLFLLETEVL